MRTLFQTIKQQFLEGNDLVLVSVTASSGSTPRGAGSRMLVGKNGRISGTIGGGAVEYRAECMALDILEKKESCEHEFRLNHKDVENIGMICGGDVTAFFQYLDHNDPIIMEITETAEKFYEAKRFLADLRSSHHLRCEPLQSCMRSHRNCQCSFFCIIFFVSKATPISQ